MSERFPYELCVSFVIGAVEKDNVEMGIEAQVGGCPLHDRDSARFRSAGSAGRCAFGIERMHGVDENADHH